MSKLIKQLLGSALIFSALASMPAHAWNTELIDKTVQRVGVHAVAGGSTGFVLITEGLPNTCAYGVLYFDNTTALGKAMLNILIVAKTTNQKVWLSYTLPATPGTCVLERAELYG